jgi:hypothetical protein
MNPFVCSQETLYGFRIESPHTDADRHALVVEHWDYHVTVASKAVFVMLTPPQNSCALSWHQYCQCSPVPILFGGAFHIEVGACSYIET